MSIIFLHFQAQEPTDPGWWLVSGSWEVDTERWTRSFGNVWEWFNKFWWFLFPIHVDSQQKSKSILLQIAIHSSSRVSCYIMEDLETIFSSTAPWTRPRASSFSFPIRIILFFSKCNAESSQINPYKVTQSQWWRVWTFSEVAVSHRMWWGWRKEGIIRKRKPLSFLGSIPISIASHWSESGWKKEMNCWNLHFTQ
jgi:hypothetical protein